MFGSDKRSGFLSGVAGGLKTAKKKNVSAPVNTPSAPAPRVAPTPSAITSAGAAPSTPKFSSANSGTGYVKASPGIKAQVGRAVNLGQGNSLSAQVTPGKWFQKFR